MTYYFHIELLKFLLGDLLLVSLLLLLLITINFLEEIHPRRRQQRQRTDQ